MAYNPYSDIQKVFNAKVGWNNATTDEERKRQNEIANAARKNLEAYGYSDVANQISSSGADATAARKILEQYAPKSATKVTTKATTAPDSTTLSNPELITVNNNETRKKNNQLWGTQTNDREMMTGKYNKLEDTAYSNPFESEEAKVILKQYDLKAMQGRENEKASGAASNGGNIDSFAAANALRQQAALTSKGQMVALDAHNNKINNVKGILADLGVYLQNQDKGMQTTIGLQANEGQRLFENEETAKNNETARLSEQASVTGYTPTEWTIKNDATYSQFLNPDGTFKKEMENVDIQALINNTTDADTKKKLAVIRAKKMLGNYGEYGKYINQGDVAFMDGNQITEARRQFDKQDLLARDTLTTQSADNKYAIDVEREIKAQTPTEPKLTASQAKDAIKSGEINETTIAAYNYHFGGNYTVENPPSIIDKKITEPPLSEKEVTEWVEFLNNDILEKYGSKEDGKAYKALEQTGKNTYKRADADADYIIISIMGSDDLTQEQKEYLLYKKFGITEDQVNDAVKDSHYR